MSYPLWPVDMRGRVLIARPMNLCHHIRTGHDGVDEQSSHGRNEAITTKDRSRADDGESVPRFAPNLCSHCVNVPREEGTYLSPTCQPRRFTEGDM
nr:hypothetical protein CFP56_03965 [Quercus suber]